MTIAEAEKRCEKIDEQLYNIRQEYDFGSYSIHCGQIKMKPLEEEIVKLIRAIAKAKETTKIEI